LESSLIYSYYYAVIVKVSGLYNLQCGKFDVKNIIVVRTNRLRKEALINMTKGHKIILASCLG